MLVARGSLRQPTLVAAERFREKPRLPQHALGAAIELRVALERVDEQRLESVDRLTLAAELIVEAQELGHQGRTNRAGRAGTRGVQAEAERRCGLIRGISRDRFAFEGGQSAGRIGEASMLTLSARTFGRERRGFLITEEPAQLVGRRRGGDDDRKKGPGVGPFFRQRHNRRAKGLQSADANQPRPARRNH